MTTHVYAGRKQCSKCRESKPVADFTANPKLSSGLNSWCRECHAEAVREWREANPDYLAAYNASRRVTHEPRSCVQCGRTFTPKRSHSKRCPTCSADGLSTARALEKARSGGVCS